MGTFSACSSVRPWARRSY